MEEKINQALAQLESDLQNISSAREQVEKTVGTSNELQEVVAGYVSSLDSLLTNVKDWVKEISSFQGSNITGIEKSIGNIQKSCDKVIEKFTNSTDKVSDNLKQKTEDELSKFESANTKLASQVDKLAKLDEHLKSATSAIDSVKDKLGEVLKELKDSQNTQDKSLEALGKGQEKLCSKSDEIKTSCGGISKSLDSVSSTIEGISTVVNDSKNEIFEIKRNTDTYRNEIRSDISKLDEKVTALSTQLDATTKALLKSSNVNRWIVIVGIVALAVLFFVVK